MHKKPPKTRPRHLKRSNLKKVRRDALQRSIERYWHERDPIRYMVDVGSRLNRRKVVPDDWQREVMQSTARQKILNTSRQIGKSTVVAALCLHKAEFTPEALVTIYAPTQKQAKETFAKVARFYLAYGGRVNNDTLAYSAGKVNTMSLTLPHNGSRIEAMPATESSARAFSSDLVVIDEASYIKREFYTSVRPTLMMSGGDLILASTPRGRQGFFYDEWMDGEGFERYEVPANKCKRIDKTWLKNEARHMSERDFRQEYLCSFEEAEGAVFRSDIVDAAFTNEVEPLWEDFATTSPVPVPTPSELSSVIAHPYLDDSLDSFIDEVWADFEL